MSTKAIVGVGSKLSYSTDDVTFTALAQLQRFKPSGSKQAMVDQTNILTPQPFTAPLAARVDSGEVDLAGVLDPSNGSQLALGQLHVNRTLAWWKVLLSDGVTTWTFQAYVEQYVPFDVAHDKFVPFTAKLRIVGGLTGPIGTV